MDISAFINSGIYSLLVLPILIFLARVVDVSMGTVRVIFIAKGFRKYATLIGFFEVLIWLAAINQIMSNLTNYYYYIAYAGGFATGTFVGMIIEEKISFGKVMIRVITGKNSEKLVKILKKDRYRLTTHDANGPEGRVKIILSVVNRSELKNILNIVKKTNPNAFYSVEDVRYAFEGSTEKTNKQKKSISMRLLRK